jgi:hypothetical protein
MGDARPALARAVTICGGVAILVYAVAGGGFRDTEGALTGAVALPLAAGIALALLGAAIHTPLAASAGWLALALVGKATALQMIDAGPALHYQHYQPITVLWHERPWLLVIVAVQAALVAQWVGRHVSELRRDVGTSFGWMRVAAAALLSCATAATVSPSRPAASIGGSATMVR